MVRLGLINSSSAVIGYLDIFDSDTFPLAISYSVGTIQNLTARKGNSSKTFKIPATKNNNTLFKSKYITSVDDERAFQVTCFIEADGMHIDLGILQVTAIGQKENPSEYECVFYSSNTEWVDELKDKSIRDYEYNNAAANNANPGSAFSSAPMPFNASVNGLCLYDYFGIANSWLETQDDWDYVYPLSCYGDWPSKNQVTNQNFVGINEFVPYVYAKSILREAFLDIGWNLQSNFFDTDDFKALVVNCISRNHRTLEMTYDIPNRTLNASEATNFYAITPDDPTTLFWINQFGNLLAPTGNDMMRTGLVSFASKEGFAPSGLIGGGIGVVSVDGSTGGVIVRNGGEVSISASCTVTNGSAGTVRYVMYGEVAREDGNNVQLIASATDSATVTNTTPVTLSASINDITVEEGDYIYWMIKFDTPIGTTMNVTISDISLNTTFTEPQEVRNNETYYIANNLEDLKVLDFINGLANMFNLYFLADNGTKTLYCEPREDFYSALNTALDWTDKLDVNSETNFRYDYSRELQFLFKEDNADGYVNEINETLDTPLGGVTYNLPDYFKKGKQELKNKAFAYTDSFLDRRVGDNIRISRFWQEHEVYPEWDYGFNTRLLYFEYAPQYNNGSTTENLWRFTSNTNSIDKVPSARSDNENMLLYYPETNGLLNTYFSNLLGTIEKNTLLTVRINLKSTDIMNLDLRKPIYISGNDLAGYYYINQIIDFQPTKAQLTKVELIPVIKYFNYADKGTLPKIDEKGEFRLGKSGGGGMVAKNGYENYAVQGSLAVGMGVDAYAKNQFKAGAFTIASSVDVFQVGAGTSPIDRYRGLTFDGQGNIFGHAGEIYTTEGIEIKFAENYLEDLITPSGYQKIYLDGGNNG